MNGSSAYGPGRQQPVNALRGLESRPSRRSTAEDLFEMVGISCAVTGLGVNIAVARLFRPMSCITCFRIDLLVRLSLVILPTGPVKFTKAKGVRNNGMVAREPLGPAR
jgi:hypothetical protein